MVKISAKSQQRDRDAASLAKWMRAKKIVQTLIRDPRLESPLGRMLLIGYPRPISEAAFEAGVRALRIMQRYDAIVLNVSRTPRPLEMDGGGISCREEAPAGVIREVTEAFMKLEASMGQCRVQGAREACKSLLRGDEQSIEDANRAVECLRHLVQVFKLDAPSNDKIAGKAKKYRFIGEEKLEEALRISL